MKEKQELQETTNTIKLETTIFEDEAVKKLYWYPDADSLMILFIKLRILAVELRNGGKFILDTREKIIELSEKLDSDEISFGRDISILMCTGLLERDKEIYTIPKKYML